MKWACSNPYMEHLGQYICGFLLFSKCKHSRLFSLIIYIIPLHYFEKRPSLFPSILISLLARNADFPSYFHVTYERDNLCFSVLFVFETACRFPFSHRQNSFLASGCKQCYGLLRLQEKGAQLMQPEASLLQTHFYFALDGLKYREKKEMQKNFFDVISSHLI